MNGRSVPLVPRRLVVTGSGAVLLTVVAGCADDTDPSAGPVAAPSPAGSPASPASSSPTPEDTPEPSAAESESDPQSGSDSGSGYDYGDNGGGGSSGNLLGSASDVPVGGGVVFAKQKVVVTQPEKGTYRAFSAVCTHQGCLVEKVAGGTISCPCHGSQYDISDASVQGGPAPKPLPERSVTVAGDDLYLNG